MYPKIDMYLLIVVCLYFGYWLYLWVDLWVIGMGVVFRLGLISGIDKRLLPASLDCFHREGKVRRFLLGYLVFFL